MAEEKVEETTLLLRQTQVLEDVGRKSAADVAQVESQKAEADYELTRQRNLLASSLLELKKEMAYPMDEELKVSQGDWNDVTPENHGDRLLDSGQNHEPVPMILGTQIEEKDGLLTGRFLTKNCYGEEKVNRLLKKYPNRKDYHLMAYGDSQGDKELLAFADEAHYKPFR